MIRIAGVICLIAGFGAWGLTGVLKLRRRAAVLGVITRSLGTLCSELFTRMEPMPELVRRLTNECEEPFAAFTRKLSESLPELGEERFHTLWRRAAAETLEPELAPDEAVILFEAGRSLGRYDTEEQREALRYAIRRFEEFTRRAEQQRDKNSKIRAVFCVSAGIFASLILF